MSRAVVIHANSLIQLYVSLAVTQTYYDINEIDIYLSLGSINGQSISPDLTDEYHFQYFDDNVDKIRTNYRTNEIVLVSASHLPYELILRIGFWKIAKIYRVEEGIGSYGNFYSKTLALWEAGYQKLVPKHAIGILCSHLFEFIRLQKAVYLIDKNNNVNILLLNELKKVMAALKPIDSLPSRYTILVLTTDFLQERITIQENMFLKGHPAWGGDDTYAGYSTYSAERLLQASSINTIISQLSSAGIYGCLLTGTLSVSLTDPLFTRSLTKRQLSIFNKYCYVISC